MKKSELFALLTSSETPWIDLGDALPGILQSVQREDGSGKCFILEVLRKYPSGKSVIRKVFVRTVD